MPTLRSLARASCLAVFLAVAACDEPKAPAAEAPAAPAADENLEALVQSLVDAVQAKQSEFVLSHVARDFKEDGGLDYFDVRALVEKYALGPEIVGSRLESFEVTPGGEGRQRVKAQVAFTRGERLAAGTELPESAVVYRIELVFARNEGRWEALGGRYARESPPATSAATPATSTR